MPATLIVIEGPDKVGKETQSKLLVEALQKEGYRVALVEVPFNDRLTHALIYKMLDGGLASKVPNAFQFVHFLNKLLFQSLRLPALMRDNDYVIFDRWSLSSVVYGHATDVHAMVNDWLCSFLKTPDATVILMGHSYEVMREDDAYEADDFLQRRVRFGYTAWANKHPLDTRIVDCEGARMDVHERLLRALDDLGVV